MGILQLARVLHVVIATHFWGYRSKSGISVSEITLGIAGMPNRIADNFNGVGHLRVPLGTLGQLKLRLAGPI